MSEATKAQTKPLDVSTVATLLGSAARLTSMVTAQLKDAGLGLPEWLTLQQLARGDGKLKPRALLAATGLNRKEFQLVLKSLDNQKYVATEKKDGVMKITDKGHAALGKAEATLQSFLFSQQSEANARVGRAIRLVSKFVAKVGKREKKGAVSQPANP